MLVLAISFGQIFQGEFLYPGQGAEHNYSATFGLSEYTSSFGFVFWKI